MISALFQRINEQFLTQLSLSPLKKDGRTIIFIFIWQFLAALFLFNVILLFE